MKVKREFIERFKKNAWSNEEDRDDIDFWEQQKLEYLEENQHTKICLKRMKMNLMRMVKMLVIIRLRF